MDGVIFFDQVKIIWPINIFGPTQLKSLDPVILLYISYDINDFYYYILQMEEVLPEIG